MGFWLFFCHPKLSDIQSIQLKYIWELFYMPKDLYFCTSFTQLCCTVILGSERTWSSYAAVSLSLTGLLPTTTLTRPWKEKQQTDGHICHSALSYRQAPCTIAVNFYAATPSPSLGSAVDCQRPIVKFRNLYCLHSTLHLLLTKCFLWEEGGKWKVPTICKGSHTQMEH